MMKKRITIEYEAPDKNWSVERVVIEPPFFNDCGQNGRDAKFEIIQPPSEEFCEWKEVRGKNLPLPIYVVGCKGDEVWVNDETEGYTYCPFCGKKIRKGGSE